MLLRVRGISRATPASRLVRLELGRAPLPYRPGQAARLGLPGRAAHGPYSIACGPDAAREQGCVDFLIDTEGGSRFAPLLAGLRRGSKVEVGPPFGSFVFPDKPRERRILFIAGGSGIAPLRAMLHHALARRYPGEIAVLYSARSPRHFAFGAELRRLAARRRIELIMTASREAGAGWTGGRGRIDETILGPLVSRVPTLCFVCGPSGLVAGVSAILEGLGVPRRRIRTETWIAITSPSRGSRRRP
jgi:ferredoxin-NADP reductase